jgi:hypothetical protein
MRFAMRRLSLGLFVLLAAFLTASVASAESGKQNSALLKALRAASGAPTQPSLVVAKSGKFWVKAVFTRATPATGTLYCSAMASNFNGSQFFENSVTHVVPLTFTGTHATCSLVMPFQWSNADSTQGVIVQLGISNNACVLAASCASGSIHLVDNYWAREIALPTGNGVTTTVDFGTLVF